MENIEYVCRHFKLMRENCDLDIDFTLRECFVHKREKATVYLNFDNDKNINVELEQKTLKEYIYCLLPKESGWFLSLSRECKLKGKSRSYKFENIVEFILRKDYTVAL